MALLTAGVAGTDGLIGKPPEAANDDVSVIVKTWVDEDQVSSAAVVRLWIAVDNKSTHDIEGVGFDEFQTPGFVHVAGCWKNATPACHAGNGTPLDPLPVVPARNRLVTWALLKRDDSLPDGGKVVLTGLLHWKPTRSRAPIVNAATSSSVIELLPTVWYKAPLLVWTRDLTKDLVIPFTVLIGTLLFSFLLQKRGERQVILTEMLEKVTRDAERHLLPVSAAASGFIGEVEQFHDAYTKAPDAQRPDVWNEHENEVLFSLIAFKKQTRYMKDTIGGFYLKLQSAERVAAYAINAFVDCLEGRLGAKAEVDRIVAAVIPSITFGSFGKRIEDAKGNNASPAEKAFLDDVKVIRAKLPGWVQKPEFSDQEILTLRLLTAVLDVEIDRGFQRWYERAPHLNRWLLRRQSRQCSTICKTLKDRSDPSYDAFEMLRVALIDYRRDTAGLHGWVWRSGFRLRRWAQELRGASNAA